MAGMTIKLQTNIPVTGVLEYVDYIKTRTEGYKDQIALRGKWDVGEGRIYLPLALESDLTKLGLIGEKQANGNYPLLQANPKIELLKTENGTTRFTAVKILSAGAEQKVAKQAAAPVYSQNNQPNASPASDTYHPVATADSKKAWDQIILTHRNCMLAAVETLKELGGTVDNSDVIATANCLFSERSRRGILTPMEEVKSDIPF